MQENKSVKSKVGSSDQTRHDDTPLVGVAHTIGTTLGTAAAKAEAAAKEIGTIAQDVSMTALEATRGIYERAQKRLRPGATSGSTGARKPKPNKKKSGKSTGRSK